jgi:hypothetical protein
MASGAYELERSICQAIEKLEKGRGHPEFEGVDVDRLIRVFEEMLVSLRATYASN